MTDVNAQRLRHVITSLKRICLGFAMGGFCCRPPGGQVLGNVVQHAAQRVAAMRHHYAMAATL
ncbi:hypothetical protein [Paraburkholderia hospita]|uniref:hypothetical protein n=1 Tax=Paraburkholderia hospita TaxID=169430 RepID=UPI001F625574|nr:hypothetical protein [Paraburkholderia hospita]